MNPPLGDSRYSAPEKQCDRSCLALFILFHFLYILLPRVRLVYRVSIASLQPGFYLTAFHGDRDLFPSMTRGVRELPDLFVATDLGTHRQRLQDHPKF